MGFKIIEKKYLKDIDTIAYVYEHIKTKARLIFFKNNDENKSFSITFKTLPYSHNGIFHILEHSVLCGSDKYPVKEPFVELIKGSFNTFINAMTFPDKTMYPVSSKDEKDLAILMDIYLDAVFNPKLLHNDNILKQEGWHYHLEAADSPIEYKGVVYNEMKGVYSSINEIVDMHIAETLFKDTIYKYSYGGKPEAITSINQKEFIETYQYNYHPSNSYIFLYGDLEIDNYLEQIDSYLSTYEYKDYSDYKIDKQSEFDHHIIKKYYYHDNCDNKHYVIFNYVIGENNDLTTINSIDIIDEILLGHSNTEFRKYFIDNDICEDVYSYIQKDRLQVTYSIIYKNVKNEFIEDLSSKHTQQLENIIQNKFDKEQIQATINRKIFSIKEEINKTSSPKGVSYAIRLLRNWLYNQNPLEVFDYEKIINQLKDNLANNQFEKVAKTLLLDNNKRNTINLYASNDNHLNIDSQNLNHSDFTQEDLNEIINDTLQLKKWQNKKDSKTDLKKIKSVNPNEVNIKNPFKETKFDLINQIKFGHYDINTSDIVYSKILFDISRFNKVELQYAALINHLLFNINTKNKSELEISKEIDMHLGGIYSNINIIKNEKNEQINIKFVISSKNLVEKNEQLADILIENTLNYNFSNEQAIYNLILELKLNLENKFKEAGHAFINKRISSYYSLQHKIEQYISEYDFYLFIKDLLEQFNFEIIKNHLTETMNKIFISNHLLVSSTCSKDNNEDFVLHILKYVKQLKNMPEDNNEIAIIFNKKDYGYAEGFHFDTKVQYVGLGFDNGANFTGSLLVLRHILNYDYLWNNVRVKNGAYGAGVTINKYKEVGFWSYRDPNLKETLAIYKDTYQYIENLHLDDDELNKYIIGTLNAFNQLMSPLEKSTLSLTNYLTNSSKNRFDELVNEIKNTTIDDIKLLAKSFNLNNSYYSCVISSKETITKHKHMFDKIIEIN